MAIRTSEGGRLPHGKRNFARQRKTLCHCTQQYTILRLEPLEERRLLSVQPDLTVTNLTLGSPSAVVGNNYYLPVTWTVKNQGTWAPPQNWQDAFYLSSNNFPDSSALLIGSVSRDEPFPLAIGGSYTSSTMLTIPQTTLSGNQYLLVVTDPQNTIEESNTANNTLAAPISLSAPNVKLVISNASAQPTSVTAGNGATVSVSWTVINEGTDPAQTSWVDNIYLSSHTTVNSSAQLLGESTAPSTLAAGASYSQTESFTVSNTALLGNENLLIEANADDVQAETSAGNTAVVPISVSVPGNVDLQVSNFSAPTSATLGGAVPLTWTVTNTGSGTASADWTDAIYASPTATFNAATAKSIASFPNTGPLAAGASYTRTESVELPASAAGSSYLLVVANADNSQSVTDTSDDTAAAAITLAKPSLAISGLSRRPAPTWAVRSPCPGR